jgi:hypothetical protein
MSPHQRPLSEEEEQVMSTNHVGSEFTVTARGLSRSLVRVVTLTVALAVFTLTPAVANAVSLVETSGTLGKVYGWGGTVCDPFRSGGFASRYVEIGSPLVSESDGVYDPSVSVIGGGQSMRWQPWLEKWVDGRWRIVWVGGWESPSSYSAVTGFDDPMVNVYRLGRFPGRGYFRSGGTVLWLPDANHQGGAIRYRHSAGNYFTRGYADQGGASATALSRGYCWAG